MRSTGRNQAAAAAPLVLPQLEKKNWKKENEKRKTEDNVTRKQGKPQSVGAFVSIAVGCISFQIYFIAGVSGLLKWQHERKNLYKKRNQVACA